MNSYKMKKVVWLFIAVVSFVSCDKEENVPLEYQTIMDEVFIDNSNSWNTDELTLGPTVVATFDYDFSNNGSFKIRYTVDGFVADYLDYRPLELGQDFLLRSYLFNESGSKSSKQSGILLDYIDDKNYTYAAVNTQGAFDLGIIVNGRDTFKGENGKSVESSTDFHINVESKEGVVVCSVNDTECVSFSLDTVAVNGIGMFAEAGVNINFKTLYAGNR